MNVMAPVVTGSPCSRSVSRTAPSATSGTGFSVRRLTVGLPFRAGRCWAGSVLSDHAALTFAGSHDPSASRLIRPAFSARRTAVSLTPICRASCRLLVVAIHRSGVQSSTKCLIPIVFWTCFSWLAERSCARQVDHWSAEDDPQDPEEDQQIERRCAGCLCRPEDRDR